MAKVVVNNTNIIVELNRKGPGGRGKGRRDLPIENVQTTQIVEEIDRLRERVRRIACSSTWAEDCTYRGVDYAPDFRCRCAHCAEKFPERRHPREGRESDLCGDCQVEWAEDSELALELALLRNDGERMGSVLIEPRVGRAVDKQRERRVIKGSGFRLVE